jgi:type IV secretion system protein VirB10
MPGRYLFLILACSAVTLAQESAPTPAPVVSPAPAATAAPDHAPDQPALKRRDDTTPPGVYRVEPGTRILLNMINSVSTKSAAVGDHIYLETAFPVLSKGKIVIPQGSWVSGTVTEVKRPGRVKGRGELSVRFDSLTLPNGVTRDFRAGLASVDSRTDQKLDEQQKVKGPGDKAGDVRTVADTTLAGGGIGTAIGAASGNLAKGAGIGLGAGAAAGIIGVLMTRGPDATLERGTNVEMVLDRPVEYQTAELDFSGAPPRAALAEGQIVQQNNNKKSRLPY